MVRVERTSPSSSALPVISGSTELRTVPGAGYLAALRRDMLKPSRIDP